MAETANFMQDEMLASDNPVLAEQDELLKLEQENEEDRQARELLHAVVAPNSMGEPDDSRKPGMGLTLEPVDEPDMNEPRWKQLISPNKLRSNSKLQNFKHAASMRRRQSMRLANEMRSPMSFRSKVVNGWKHVDRVLPIIHPKARGKIMWDVMIMVLIIFSAVTVPIDVSFGFTNTPELTQANYGVSIMFAMDICINFRTAFFNNNGQLIRDSRQIAREYCKFWFWVDLAATIPYDLFAKAFGLASGDSTSILGFLKTPRLLRLGRLVRLLEHVKNVGAFKVVLLLAMMVMIAHWLACIWYMLYKFGPGGPLDEWTFDMFSDADDTVLLWVSAYYQCFLMVMGDNLDPLNNYERWFFIVSSISGTCFYSAMLGQMALLVANLNIVGSRHKQRQDITLDVLRYIGIGKRDATRVIEYFTYITQFSHPTADGMAMLHELPKALYREIADDLYKEPLSKISLFHGVEEPFLTAVSLRMKMVMFTPKETIFKAGDLGQEMYTIRKGSVAVVGAYHQMIGLLSAGQTFGQFALLTPGAKRTADTVAMSHCDLCVLRAADLKALMRDYPRSGKRLQENIARELHSMQVAGRGVFDGDEKDGENPDSPGPPDKGPAPYEPPNAATGSPQAATQPPSASHGSFLNSRTGSMGSRNLSFGSNKRLGSGVLGRSQSQGGPVAEGSQRSAFGRRRRHSKLRPVAEGVEQEEQQAESVGPGRHVADAPLHTAPPGTEEPPPTRPGPAGVAPPGARTSPRAGRARRARRRSSLDDTPGPRAELSPAALAALDSIAQGDEYYDDDGNHAQWVSAARAGRRGSVAYFDAEVSTLDAARVGSNTNARSSTGPANARRSSLARSSLTMLAPTQSGQAASGGPADATANAEALVMQQQGQDWWRERMGGAPSAPAGAVSDATGVDAALCELHATDFGGELAAATTLVPMLREIVALQHAVLAEERTRRSETHAKVGALANLLHSLLNKTTQLEEWLGSTASAVNRLESSHSGQTGVLGGDHAATIAAAAEKTLKTAMKRNAGLRKTMKAGMNGSMDPKALSAAGFLPAAPDMDPE